MSASVKCPKCSYQRQPSDTTPDWQCPKCGIAYAKFSGDFPKVKAVRKIAEADEGFGNRVVYALLGGLGGAVIGAIAWFGIWTETADDGGPPMKIQFMIIGGAVLFSILGFLMKSKVVDMMFNDPRQGKWTEEEIQEDDKWRKIGFWLMVVLVTCFMIWVNYTGHGEK